MPLLKLRPRKDLVETLIVSSDKFKISSKLPCIFVKYKLSFFLKHEMIHAYLFVTKNNRDRDGHGPEFQSHMYRINRESGTNITVINS